MIRVNLKSRKAAVGVTAGSATGSISGVTDVKGKFASMFARVGASGGGFSADHEQMKSFAVLIILYGAIVAGAWWFVDDQQTKSLGTVNTEIAALDSKLNLLDSELGKTRGYEQIKKSLEGDEKTIRTKITTIQELIRDRATPPKILMTLSETIPSNVWLREFSLKDRKFKISGLSDGMDVVSDFMRSLEETLYFRGVVLKSSKQQVTNGRLSAQFELEADRR